MVPVPALVSDNVPAALLRKVKVPATGVPTVRLPRLTFASPRPKVTVRAEAVLTSRIEFPAEVAVKPLKFCAYPLRSNVDVTPTAGFIVTATPPVPVVKGLSTPNLTVPFMVRAVTAAKEALTFAVPPPLCVMVAKAAKDELMFTTPAPLCVRVAKADIEAPTLVVPAPLCVRVVTTVCPALMFNVPVLLVVMAWVAA